MRDGYSITRHGPAIALAGKLCLKLHRTTPLLPCALVTLPQIARYLLPFVTFLALYTYTTLPYRGGQGRGAREHGMLAARGTLLLCHFLCQDIGQPFPSRLGDRPTLSCAAPLQQASTPQLI